MERGAPAPPVADTGRRSNARQRRAFRVSAACNGYRRLQQRGPFWSAALQRRL
ncbi:MAG: hypothetical protein ACK559_11655 [bacterium]